MFMIRRFAARSTGLVLVAAVLVSGCSNGASKPAGGSKPSTGAAQESQGGTQSIKNQPLTSIPHVGKVSWSCDGSHRGRYSITLAADRMSATDVVIWAENGDYIPGKETLQPGHKLVFTGMADQTLQVKQATEPRTLTANVSIRFKGCDGTPIVHKTVKVKKTF
jgi:hypothetical protein